ncbi:L,D-transpeptidase family protein [Enterococcus songbeiensis]|uniref:L,D-transpeptidase family protein n=1 Tax=Enterococcus songbeiensis TaxID=2559927 RepID=UPI0010F660CE|nr:L,D-transpeptidase family protein [Enterococcus songbeiensis]
MTRASRHKSHSKTIIFVILGLIVAISAGYFIRGNHYAERFLPNTTINDVDISNLTVTAANKKLKGNADEQEFSITDDGQVWKSLKKTQLGLKTDYTSELNKVLSSQNQWTWGVAYVFAAEKDSLDGVAVDEDKLNQEISTLETELTALNKERTATQDAKLDKEATGFKITAEVQGDSLDTKKIVTDLKKAVSSSEDSLELADYVEKPAVTSTDESLTKQLDALNKIATINATYSINGETFQIPTETIMDWLTYKDEKAAVDKEKIRSYVADLGEQYNTSTNDSTFNSTKRGEVSVPAGTWSWTIQTDAETDALAEAMLAGEDFTRSPIVQGSTTADQALIGDTYIEVDLENQHMWYYKDGAVALETDVITGKPKTPTPAGVFYVWNKERNATLKGQNDDGSDYASPVDYWLPIDWTGVGIHDSDWQTSYGGDLWKTRGSHGCVNTPPSVMKELYGLVSEGTPVIVF